jgi:hypothetical protein
MNARLRRVLVPWTLFAVLGMLGCGNSKLTSVNVSPESAVAQHAGQVQFTATGTFSGSSQQAPLKNITWCVGSSSGMCNGNIASAAMVDGNGLAQCTGVLVGTVTILAGTGHSMGIPDRGAQLNVFGTAQLTCP